MSWPSSLPSWVSLKKLVMSDLQKILDALGVFHNGADAYTPAWTASTTNPTLGNGTLTGRIIHAGKFVYLSWDLTIGSTTTLGSGVYGWSIPVTLQNFRAVAGTVELFDASAVSTFLRLPQGLNGTSVGAADMAAARVSNSSPIAWATGDHIVGTLVLEEA